MDAASGAIAWLLDPAHWGGSDGVVVRIWEHLWISALSVAIALMVALPIGLWSGHTRHGGALAVNVANIGRAVPSYAVLVMVLPISLAMNPDLGLDVIPTFVAMTLLAIPPVLVTAHAGIRDVDPDLVEAARGMGMREGEILRSIEIPIALPVIVGGIQTAAVQVVATTTLGALVAYGGLGRYIVDGIARNEDDRLFAGVILVALLAVAAEAGLGWLKRRLTSPGLASPAEAQRAAAAAAP